MPIGSFRNPLIYAVATLMITPHGTAQAPAASKTVKPRETSSGQASGREAASGMATGRITDKEGAHDSLNARNSAHATESVAPSAPADNKKMGNAHSNPLYQSNGNSGQNPLHQAKDKTNGAAPAPQAYKDGEDQTTRTRPGNKKTN